MVFSFLSFFREICGMKFNKFSARNNSGAEKRMTFQNLSSINPYPANVENMVSS